MRAFDLATSQPWLITPEMLEQIVAIAERTHDLNSIEALAARQGRPLRNARRAHTREGVAVIEAVGPIFRYANLFTEISGATSTEVLAMDLQAALDDPMVHGIVLDFNSPGGLAAGINELGNMVAEGRNRKRIIAYAGGQMQSAAYWIGSAADEIVIDETAVLGSIGALATHVSTREREARSGVRTIHIVSSQSPDKLIDPEQDEGRAKLQKIVDDLAAVFVGAVARNRNVDVETVLSDFGRGGSMVGNRAIEAGLADRIGSLEGVIAELSEPSQLGRRSFAMSTSTQKAAKGPITVSNTTELRAALVAGHTADEITVTSVDVEKIKSEAAAAAKADAEAAARIALDAAVTKATADATAAERTRVLGIQEISMVGFEKEVAKAITDGTTVEATAVALTKAARERGGTVAQQRGNAPAAIAHGGAASSQAGAGGGGGKWSGIAARLNKKRA